MSKKIIFTFWKVVKKFFDEICSVMCHLRCFILSLCEWLWWKTLWESYNSFCLSKWKGGKEKWKRWGWWCHLWEYFKMKTHKFMSSSYVIRLTSQGNFWYGHWKFKVFTWRMKEFIPVTKKTSYGKKLK